MLPSVLTRAVTPTSSPSRTSPSYIAEGDLASNTPVTEGAWLEEAGTRILSSAVTVNSKVFSMVKEFQSQIYGEVEVREKAQLGHKHGEVTREQLNDKRDRTVGDDVAGFAGMSFDGGKKREIMSGAEALAFVSHFITNLFVTLAILIKQSPIPSAITNILEQSLDVVRIVDAEYKIHQKVVTWGQAFVRFQVWVSGVVFMAVLRAVVAYQKAPAYQRPPHDGTPPSPPDSPKIGPSSETGISSPTRPGTSSTSALALRQRLSSLMDLSLTPSPTQTVKLSVGGVPFQTTRATLCADSGSLLSQLFGGTTGKRKVKCSIIDGAYFIDRDGTHFRHILNFLRGVDTISQIEDKMVLRELLTEAEYYELAGLISMVSDLLVEEHVRAGKASTGKTRTTFKSYLPTSIQTLL